MFGLEFSLFVFDSAAVSSLFSMFQGHLSSFFLFHILLYKNVLL